MDEDDFFMSCRKLNALVVSVPKMDIPGEEGYICINRVYFQMMTEDELLYIDSDTFVFGDVGKLFDTCQTDFAACPARWVSVRGYPNTLKIFPFCGGVHLWRNGKHRQWASALPEISKELRERRHPVSEWLYQIDAKCYNREEFTIPIFLERTGLSYQYFQRDEVMLLETEADFDNIQNSTVIFHCYTGQWTRVMDLLVPKKRRVFFRPQP